MIQTLINNIRAYELPIILVVGLAGGILFSVGDGLNTRVNNWKIDGYYEDRPVAEQKRDKSLCLALMIAGGILALASCISLGVGGYYGQFLELLR